MRILTTKIGSLHYPNKTQNYCGAILPCISTTNLKDKYSSNKIIIKIFMSLGEFCCSQQTKGIQITNFHFSRSNVLWNKFGILTISSTIIKMSHWRFLDFNITFSPLPWQSIEAQDHQNYTHIICCYLNLNSVTSGYKTTFSLDWLT